MLSILFDGVEREDCVSRALGLSEADLWVPRRGFSTTRLVVDEDASKAASPRSSLAGLDVDGRL